VPKYEAGEWVRPPGQEGRRVAGGKVSQDDRWWSSRWWRGHWLKHRKSDGEWADGAGATARHRESLSFLTPSAGRKVSTTEHTALEYQAYLEGRQQQAERATVGHAPDAYFTGRPRSTAKAPEELRDWFRANGPNLTAAQFRRKSGGGGSGWFGHGDENVSTRWFG